MKIRILCIGRIKEEYHKKQIELLCQEINKGRNSIEIIEYPDIKIPYHINDKVKEDLLNRECSKMYEKITKDDYVIALCIEGKELTSKEHLNQIKKAMDMDYGRVTYLIGGSLGLSHQIKNRADFKLSFSKMTFPHQLMRVVLCEEIKNVLDKMNYL